MRDREAAGRWVLGGAALVAAGALIISLSMREEEPLIEDRPLAVFVGDSYTYGEGLPADDRGLRWTSLVSAERGWEEYNVGCSGAGYARPGPVCGTDYRGETAPLAPEAAPDVIIVSGGRNDLGFPEDRVAEAVEATYADLAARYPGACVVAVSAIGDVGEPPAGLDALNREVAESARAHGGVFVDIGAPLRGRPDLLGPDRMHPNVAGHAVLAEALLAALDGEPGCLAG